MVPTRTENCFLQSWHVHSRRYVGRPSRVFRPFVLMRVELSMEPQCGQMGPSGQRSSSMNFHAAVSSLRWAARLTMLMSFGSIFRAITSLPSIYSIFVVGKALCQVDNIDIHRCILLRF